MLADNFLNPLSGQMDVYARIVVAVNPLCLKAHPLKTAHMNAQSVNVNLR